MEPRVARLCEEKEREREGAENKEKERKGWRNSEKRQENRERQTLDDDAEDAS